MARAKRTDRADARRRYRQLHGEELEDNETLEAPPPVPGRGARPAAPPERPSLRAAFRGAYHRANVREDIGLLPSLLMTRSFLLAILLIVVGTAAFLTVPSNPIASLSFQALVLPPAMAPIFVVGFFARRASYLLGFIVAIVDVAAYALVVFNTGPELTTVEREQLVYSAISVGPLSGIFFAASAAWYRRFLQLTNARAADRARARARERARAGKAARS